MTVRTLRLLLRYGDFLLLLFVLGLTVVVMREHIQSVREARTQAWYDAHMAVTQVFTSRVTNLELELQRCRVVLKRSEKWKKVD
jgi:hypothetical protein